MKKKDKQQSYIWGWDIVPEINICPRGLLPFNDLPLTSKECKKYLKKEKKK